jgi:hypothetical protein
MTAEQGWTLGDTVSLILILSGHVAVMVAIASGGGC